MKAFILKVARNGLGLIIVFFDWVTRPKKITRSPEAQLVAQGAVSDLSLYQLYACPFCVKTRRVIHQLNVDIEARDINKDSAYREQLQAGGGRIKVPCLRIEEAGDVRWMYESNDIVEFLKQRIAV